LTTLEIAFIVIAFTVPLYISSLIYVDQKVRLHLRWSVLWSKEAILFHRSHTEGSEEYIDACIENAVKDLNQLKKWSKRVRLLTLGLWRPDEEVNTLVDSISARVKTEIGHEILKEET
jgi:hypothetical protein